MKQVEILNIYRILGESKMTTLEVGEIIKVVKIRKALRSIAESLEAFMKDIQEKAALWESMSEKQRLELNNAVNDELLKEVEIEFEKLSEESIAKLIQENGFKTKEIDFIGIVTK